jgi:hypothetical protein
VPRTSELFIQHIVALFKLRSTLRFAATPASLLVALACPTLPCLGLSYPALLSKEPALLETLLTTGGQAQAGELAELKVHTGGRDVWAGCSIVQDTQCLGMFGGLLCRACNSWATCDWWIGWMGGCCCAVAAQLSWCLQACRAQGLTVTAGLGHLSDLPLAWGTLLG